MAHQLDVAALYGDGWNSPEEHLNFSADLTDNMPATTGLVMDYLHVDDLVQQVDALLAIDPDKPCLRSLEIWAHANPGLINDLSTGGAPNWGTKLKTLKWCDNGSIYLAGCNTGLSLGAPFPPARRVPIAKSLADAMRYDPASFPVHITVYGSAGYLHGCHTIGRTSTERTFTETSWHAAWTLPPIWREKTVWEPYDNSRDATGDQVWNEFYNWK
jgi:hypothetical protein